VEGSCSFVKANPMRIRMRFILLVLALFLTAPIRTVAQEYFDRDSLWQEFKKAKQDTNKVWLLIRLGQQYETHDTDSALLLYESALKLSNELNYMRGRISYYTNATYVYNLKGMYDTALALNLKSVELAKEFGDPERLAACLGNVAASYTMRDQHEKAIEIYLQIIPLFEKLPTSTNQAVIYENLNVLYNELGQYEKAKEYGTRSLNIFRKTKNEYGIARALNNLAISQVKLGEFSKGLASLKEAEIIAKRTDFQFALMITNLNFSDTYIDLGNFSMIKGYCENALYYARKLNDPSSEAIALRGIAIYYLNMNDPDKAEPYAKQSLEIARKAGSLKDAGHTYSTLAEIALLKRDFQGNNRYSMKSDSIRTVLLNESIAKNVQNIEAKYESEKKEQKIRDLEQEAQIKDLSIERNRLVNAVLIGTLISLLVIALLARHNYRQKKRLLTKDNQVKEARIAQLESEKLVLAGEAVIKGQEEERGRLAKDLHDGLGGMLSGVKFSLSNMKSNVILDADSMLVFERSLDMLDHSISELRRVAHNMMPEVLVRFGLSEALKSYCESLRTSQMFKIDYQSVGVVGRLPEKTEIFVFRIVQELLNNVIKHAQASHVLVQLAQHETEVSLTVEDNGIGFNPHQQSTVGAGLTSVQSRVEYLKGKIDIQSNSGQGTSVHVTIPA
jgi:two-component system, NarL family, sensor kinase